ncbi:hypothetical protein ABEB36_006522 [Hypothenemus hampei]|uniref:Neuroparsin n=1 Tax=Hypothenemus hampei TaxID=57062 RepID=A0ABD1EQT1_HYPHA
MHSSLVLMLVFTLTFIVSVHSMSITESWVCKPCATQQECDEKPNNICVWGEARDACGRRICAKGPSERCGGSLNVLGVCGEGMMCKADEHCHGCSIQTMECSHN